MAVASLVVDFLFEEADGPRRRLDPLPAPAGPCYISFVAIIGSAYFVSSVSAAYCLAFLVLLFVGLEELPA